MLGPCLILAFLRSMTLSSPRLLGWIFYLVEKGLVDAVFLVPPSGAFHQHRPAFTAPAFPVAPLRFRPGDPRFVSARRVLFRSLAVLVCSACGIACAVQVPLRSRACSLPQWKAASRLPGVSESIAGPFSGPGPRSSPALRFLSCGAALRKPSPRHPRYQP